MASLYTHGQAVLRTAAQFASYSEIRAEPGDLTTVLQLGLSAPGSVDLTTQLGPVAVVFHGSSGDDTVVAGAGNDVLFGGTGRDVLYGGAGDDYISTVWGDTVGGDAFYGGTGNDTFSVSEFDIAAGIAVYGGDGFDTLVMDGPYGGPDMPGFVLTEGQSIEAVYGTFVDAASRHNAVFDLGNARFTGQASLAGHDDYFRALHGDYAVYGGAGDTVIGSDGANEIWAVNLAQAGAGADRLFYVTNAYGGAGNDLIVNAVKAYGGDGNDTVHGSLAGTAFGGDGSDLFILNGAMSAGGAVHFASGDLISDFERFSWEAVVLSDFDDVVDLNGSVVLNYKTAGTVDAGAGRDEVRTGAGNQVLDGGTGADTLSGGADDDIYYVDDMGDRVIEAAGGGTDKAVLRASYTFTADLANIERFEIAAGSSGLSVWGGDRSDLIYGGDGDNSVYGGGGNDVLWGQGANQLFGWNGNDVLHVNGCSGSGGSGNDTLIGAADNDVLIGGSDDDSLVGGAGADQLIGGYGDDIYIMDEFDTVTEVDYGGRDEVRFVATVIDLATISVYVEDAVGLATIASTISGNALRNHLTGTAFNDTLDGRGGIDTLTGGKGDDTYHVDNIDDRIEEIARQGTDTVISTAQEYHLDAEVENGVAAGNGIGLFGNDLNNLLSTQYADAYFEGNAFFGGSGNDTIYGGIGSDTLAGGTGADVMIGGAGKDYFYVDNAGDVVGEVDWNDDSDRVLTTLTKYRLPGSVEELYALNSDGTTLIGNALDNELVGNAGDDSVRGGDGRDVPDGATGHDVLTGGNGVDFFVFDTGSLVRSRDIIVDFSAAEDVIVLENSVAGLFTTLTEGWLAPDYFKLKGTPLDANDRILYDKVTGALSYDADGSGAGHAVVFAVLANHANLSAANILVL
ncbi:MAG: hypothetical protein ABI832_02595 [bacterium]